MRLVVGLVPVRGRGVLFGMMLLAGCAASASAVQFTAGDLVVETYGNNSYYYLHGTAVPISLIEYAPTGGAAVLTDTLPTANGVGSSSNFGLAGQSDSNSEGNLQLTADGTELSLTGYSASAAAGGIDATTNAANGTSYPLGTSFGYSSATGGYTVYLAQSTDTNVPRVAAFVAANGSINSSTLLNDVDNTNNPRSVYSADDTHFYISGQGDGTAVDQGTFYGQIGANTVKNVATAPAAIYNAHDTRVVTGYGGNLYFSIDTSSGKYTGIWEYTGMPTSSSAVPVHMIPGNNGLTGAAEVYYSPQGFYFANATTLYVADTGQPKAPSSGGGLADGGIQKWIFNGASWNLAYTLTPTSPTWIDPQAAGTGETGFTAVTGEVVGSGSTAQVELFGISAGYEANDPDGLYSITDTLGATTGIGETFTELETSPGDDYASFKGIAFAPVAVPEPGSASIVCLALLALAGRKRRSPAL